MPPQIDRRRFLHAAGVGLALPFFRSAASARTATAPKRLVCIGNPFGMYPKAFYPTTSGDQWETPALLAPLERHRGRFTVFSHLDHGVLGGHAGARAFLSGVRPIHAASMPNRNITLDQRAAEFVGARTRYPVLNSSVGGSWEMCWTRDAVRVPPISNPRKIFELLFVDDTGPAALRRGLALDRDRSILDALREQSRSFEKRLGSEDRAKFDEYHTAVREVEKRIEISKAWLDEPKPEVDTPRTQESGREPRLRILFDLVALALQTDSTRVATVEIAAPGPGAGLNLSGSYHKYSHHGSRPELVEGLVNIEAFQMEELARFLDTLAATPEATGEGTLLDHTTVLFGSGLGNGNSHSCQDLPILVAGGRMRHGRHLAYPTEEGRRTPLCNLYLTLLQEFGLEIESFGTSTGSLPELFA